MKLATFAFINFMVGFISDLVLNDLSRSYPPHTTIGSLRTYFKRKSIVEAAVYAGITIVTALAITVVITKYMYGIVVPDNMTSLFYFSLLGYGVGYMLDVIIDKMKIFGDSLDPYYEIAGSGHWGAIAFIFSVVLSYIIQKIIIPLL